MLTRSAHRKRQFGWLVLALTAVLLLALIEVGRTWLTAGLKIEVEGNLAPEERDQLDMLIEPYVDAGALMLDPQVLAKDIGSLPWVGAVKLHRQSLNQLSIKVAHSLTERSSGMERTLQNLIGDLARAGDGPRIMRREEVSIQGDEATDSELLGLFLAFDQMAKDMGLEIESLRLSSAGEVELRFSGDKLLLLGNRECARRFDRFAHLYQAELASDWARVHRLDARYTDALAVSWSNAQLVASNLANAGRGASR